MPNWVTNKLIFLGDVSMPSLLIDGKLTFNKFIPQPRQMYQGDLSLEDEKCFPCNWKSWNRENWGTKWDACRSEAVLNTLRFKTAWSPPMPVIVAIANTVRVPFIHKYTDEGENFWGIETWNVNSGGNMYRCSARINEKSDFRDLYMELNNYTEEDFEERGDE